MKIKKIEPVDCVKGMLELPGDKSISHRSIMFSAMAKGTSSIKHLSNGEDVLTTVKCFQALGIDIEFKNDEVIVKGKGFKGFVSPGQPIYNGNSGTTSRLISGILAAQNFSSMLTGDEYLSKRPMKRITVPLSEMGAKIRTSENGTLPVYIDPSDELRAIKYTMPVSSAQLKSSLILAGIHLDEESCITENVPTRDHTERMLALDVRTENGAKNIYVSRKNFPVKNEYFVPSDISTSAFFIVLALLKGNSELLIKNACLNPTRTGIIEILKKMGADIKVADAKISSNEPYGDIIVKTSDLKNIEIPREIIPNIIDEIPILSVAGVFAEGEFRINGAEELRVKESDRIKALCHNFKLLGLDVEELKDGFSVSGKIKNTGAIFESFGDHRIAMAFAVLSMLLKNGGSINDFDCVAISNPLFLQQLSSITG